MTTTEELVAQVNKILDDIGIDMDGLFETFDVPSISYRLKENLSLLQELEEDLSRRVGETTPSAGFSDRKNKDPHIQWIYKKKRNRVLALERLRSAITAPKLWLRRWLKLRASILGRYPILLTTSRIRRRVAGATSGLLLITLETVCEDTPAASATSLMVIRRLYFSGIVGISVDGNVNVIITVIVHGLSYNKNACLSIEKRSG